MKLDSFTLDQAVIALQFIDSGDRDTWVKVGTALKTEFGDAGLDDWLHWSSIWDGYKESDARAVWRSLKIGAVTIGSLIAMAKDRGFIHDQPELTTEQKAEFVKEKKDKAEAAKIEREKSMAAAQAFFIKVADVARQTWDTCTSASPNNIYLLKKGIQSGNLRSPFQGLVVVCDPEKDRAELICGKEKVAQFFDMQKEEMPNYQYIKTGALVVPLYNHTGKICSLQIIDTDKKFLKGTIKSGLFSVVGNIKKDKTVPLAICEGYATGASVNAATGWPVVVALDAGQLLTQAKLWRKLYPSRDIILIADDDFITKNAAGELTNPGLNKAIAAAKAINGYIVKPLFGHHRKPEDVDFNDLQQDTSIDDVRTHLLGYKQQSQQLLETSDPWPEILDGEHAQAGLTEPSSWAEKLSITPTGVIKSNPYNLSVVLRNSLQFVGVLGYSTFQQNVVKLKPTPWCILLPGQMFEQTNWTDVDDNCLQIWCEQKFGFTPSDACAPATVLTVSRDNTFHEVQDYLHSVKWDGTLRLDNWLVDYVGAESCQYTRLVGTMWMVSAVARVMQFPVKADCVLILEGEQQGAGKSTTAAILGGKWFSDTPFVIGDKDGYQGLQGNWMIELAELDSFNKSESTKAKAFFSSATDRYRPSYGRRSVEMPRQCVFMGSTNQDAYFKDVSGNRRYWPIKTGIINFEGLRVVRDQLWAEALHRYKNGTRWWPQEEHIHLFEQQQELRYQQDVWQEKVIEYLSGLTSPTFTLGDVFCNALHMDSAQQKPPEQTRLGNILAALDIKKGQRKRDGGKRVYHYDLPANFLDQHKLSA